MTISLPPKNSERNQNVEQIDYSILQNITPVANEIDSNPRELEKALTSLGKSGLLGLQVPKKWGGLELNQQDYFNYQLQQQYLPHLSYGKILLGIAFSQLRRSGEAPVKAVPTTDGYYIEGVVPWITGWGIFQEFIIAAKLPDGQAIFGMMPFVENNQLNGNITFSKPMQLCAINSTNTVSATVTNWFLPNSRLVSIKPKNYIQENDIKKILYFTSFALGCALAGIDVMIEASKNKSLAFITDTINSLTAEVNQCRSSIELANKNPDIDFATKLNLRAKAINLAQCCAAAAVTVSSGAANDKNNAAQRVYREALVYTVSAQTTDIMEATLKTLIPRF